MSATPGTYAAAGSPESCDPLRSDARTSVGLCQTPRPNRDPPPAPPDTRSSVHGPIPDTRPHAATSRALPFLRASNSAASDTSGSCSRTRAGTYRLADAVGLSVLQVHRYEGGASQPTLDTIRRLAVALPAAAADIPAPAAPCAALATLPPPSPATAAPPAICIATRYSPPSFQLLTPDWRRVGETGFPLTHQPLAIDFRPAPIWPSNFFPDAAFSLGRRVCQMTNSLCSGCLINPAVADGARSATADAAELGLRTPTTPNPSRPRSARRAWP